MTLRLLLFGRTGQVGSALGRLAGPDLAITGPGRESVDLRDPNACAEAVQRAEVDIVVNAAAYTAVDRAEGNVETAAMVNTVAPGAIAAACTARGLPLIHLSTDYVFDGAGGRALREDDPTWPLNVYGHSKLAGERAVLDSCARTVVLRTAWVHGSDGSNFVKTMLRLAASRERLSVVDDQIGGPTAASDIAHAILRIATSFAAGGGTSGIFHYCGAPATSWLGFAKEIFRHRRAPPRLVPIATRDWPTRARRPLNTVLDCTRIRECYGIAQPDWRVSLARVLDEFPEPVA